MRHVRVDVYPDGGFARIRVYGDLTPAGREQVGLAWYDRLPPSRAAAVLQEETGVSAEIAGTVAVAELIRTFLIGRRAG